MTKPDGGKTPNADSSDAPDQIDLGEPEAPAQRVPRAHDEGLDSIEFASSQIPESEWEGWNGRSSKVAVAFPVMRDLQITGPGYPCLDCKKSGKTDRTHQFHIQASKVGKEWFGPEAGHYRVLLSLGVIAGSPQAAQRMGEQNAIDHQRGIFPSDVCRNCGRPIERLEDGGFRPICPNCGNRNGLPELAALTTQQQERIWRRDLAQGRDEAVRRERQLAHADASDVKKQQLDFVNLMRLANGLQPLDELPEYTGAKAPGSAKLSR